jgi:hypothetical protein
MKVRQGFVSNSSSSSFTCDVCGETESGWDYCLSDVDMYKCQNSHTFCESEALGDPSEDDDYERSSIAEKYCPVCQFKVVTVKDIARYYMKKAGVGDAALAELLKAEFADYGKFRDYVRGK